MGDIERGEIAVPDLQRPFVWEDTKVRDLLDSLFLGFPVGTLVLWHTSYDKDAQGPREHELQQEREGQEAGGKQEDSRNDKRHLLARPAAKLLRRMGLPQVADALLQIQVRAAHGPGGVVGLPAGPVGERGGS